MDTFGRFKIELNFFICFYYFIFFHFYFYSYYYYDYFFFLGGGGGGGHKIKYLWRRLILWMLFWGAHFYACTGVFF